MSLALATLIYEWRRYLAAVIALAFSGLLVLAQVGMFAGMVHAITATIDRSRADIMVLPPKMESLINSGGGSLPRRLAPQMYMHPEVVAVDSLDGAGGAWVNDPEPGEKRVTTFVQVWVVDTRPGSVTLPVDYSEETRVALLEPYSVAIDRTSLGRLGVELGDSAALNQRTVKVRAVLDGYPNVNQPTVVMSKETVRLLGMSDDNGQQVGPLMVQVRDPARAPQVVAELNAGAKGAYRAWTRQELSQANEKGLMEEQIIGIMLGFSVFLGVLIGIGITSQTLRGAILANIKEFASLRALGVSMPSLRLVVFELSLWVGVAGLVVTAGMTVLVTMAGAAAGLPLIYPPAAVAGVAVMLMVIAGASGLMAVGILKKSQPADLLR
jgi:putative ABC transport system permease protein